MNVELTPKEMIVAATMGVMRQVENLKLGRRPAHGAGTSADWQKHIEGCLAEFAAAKALGLYPAGAATFRAPDLGGTLEVRSTQHPRGRLLVHPEDPDGHRYLLVAGENGSYEIAGWISGEDAKRSQWWDEPQKGRPAYCVPQSALRSVVKIRGAA